MAPTSTSPGQVHPDVGVGTVIHRCMHSGAMQAALCAAGTEPCHWHAHRHRCHGTHGRWRRWSPCGARPRLQPPGDTRASLTPSLRQWCLPASACARHAIRGSQGVRHRNSLHPILPYSQCSAGAGVTPAGHEWQSCMLMPSVQTLRLPPRLPRQSQAAFARQALGLWA